MKNLFMCLLSASLFSITSVAHAIDSVAKYYSCELSAFDFGQGTDELVLTGKVQIYKSRSGEYSVEANYTAKYEGETSSEEFKEGNLRDGHLTAKEVLASEEWSAVQDLFGEEKPKGAHYFETAGFQDDAAGLRVAVIHGENGTKKSVVYLGWLPALCQ